MANILQYPHAFGKYRNIYVAQDKCSTIKSVYIKVLTFSFSSFVWHTCIDIREQQAWQWNIPKSKEEPPRTGHNLNGTTLPVVNVNQQVMPHNLKKASRVPKRETDLKKKKNFLNEIPNLEALSSGLFSLCKRRREQTLRENGNALLHFVRL